MYEASDGIKLNQTKRGECLSFELTPRDIREFLSSVSFLNSFYDGLESQLPNWLRFSNPGSTIFDLQSLRAEILYGRNIDDDIWCRGAPIHPDRLYTILKFGGDMSLEPYGNNITLAKPLHDRKFCFIIDICQNYGGSIFLMLPDGSRDVLEKFDIFKNLLKTHGVRIRPRGIRVSLLKSINVQHQVYDMQLWAGDNVFTYPMFSEANLWVAGDAFMDFSVFRMAGASDIFISVPTPEEILYSTFYREWNASLQLKMTADLEIKLPLYEQMHTIKLKHVGTATLDTYMSLGGTAARRWCGSNANPSGIFLSLTLEVNPFSEVPILKYFELNVNAKAYAFFSTDPGSSVSAADKINILEDVLGIDRLLQDSMNITIGTVASYSGLLVNESLILLEDLKQSVESFKTLIKSTLKDIIHMELDKLFQSVSTIWTEGWNRIKEHAQKFVDSIELNNRLTKYNVIKFLTEETDRIRGNISKAVEKLTRLTLNKFEDFKGFGLRFKGSLNIFGLKIIGLEFELVYSVDTIGTCSRFQNVYELLHGERSVRVFAILSTGLLKLGHFLRMDAGTGVRMAFSIDDPRKLIVAWHTKVTILGLTADVVVFIGYKGLYYHLEGRVWQRFKAQLDVFAGHGMDWNNLVFRVTGKFLANSDGDDSFNDSYLSGLRKLISDIADAASERVSQAQAVLTTAQSGVTSAQRWLSEKQASVYSANKAFDDAVRAFQNAKRKVEAAKGPFNVAIAKLKQAQRNVNNLCRIKSCSRLCIPGIKCRICHLKVWFFRIPYPCCQFTSCMFSIPNPLCVAANLACRVIRGVAYLALEAAKLFVRIPMLAMDIANAALSVAEFVVDKSRVALDLAVGAMEIAKVGLEGVKGVLEVAKLALEAVKVVVKVGLNIVSLIIQYGLQSLIDVKNCAFETQLSTEDLAIISVSCEVNALKLGWRTISFTINFRDIIQTLWQATKATVKVLTDSLGSILSGRRKRDVLHEATYKTHRIFRALRDQDIESEYFEMTLNQTINVTSQTTGFKNGTKMDDADIRIKIFQEKCAIFQNIFSFFNEANGVLLEIVSDTVKMMDNVSSLHDELSSFNLDDIQNNLTLENTGINPEVAMMDYNLTSENLTDALENAKESLSSDDLLLEISSMAGIAKSAIKSQSSEIENVKVTHQWILAMENVTEEYFAKQMCVSFLDCAHYAISELYDLFYAHSLPNTTESLSAVSLIEDFFLDLTGNTSHSIREIHNLTSDIHTQLNILDELTLFCSEPPELLTPFTNQTVKNGSVVSLICNATGNPYPSFWWFVNDVLMPAEHDMVLTIKITTEADVAGYRCMAGNIVANCTSEVAHIIIMDDDSLSTSDLKNNNDLESEIKKINTDKDKTVLLVACVTGSLVAVVIAVGVVVWRGVLRYRFRKVYTTGSFASLNIVRPDSSKPQFRTQRTRVLSTETVG